MSWNLGPQNLDWVSPSRFFATFQNLLDAQPNYEHEVALVQATSTKYQGVAPVVGGWRRADLGVGPYPPSSPYIPMAIVPETKMALEFEGVEGSTTYVDSAISWKPNKWTQRSGSGHITNALPAGMEADFPTYGVGALFLDGQTVITSPDRVDFDFGDGEWNIRMRLSFISAPAQRRCIMAKTDTAPDKRTFWIDQLPTGQIECGVGTHGPVELALKDRIADKILGRDGNVILTRDEQGSQPAGSTLRVLQTISTFADFGTPHLIWFKRVGGQLQLQVDNTVEATLNISGVDSVEHTNYTVGPVTIGGYGPPINGLPTIPLPWSGYMDRMAITIGIST